MADISLLQEDSQEELDGSLDFVSQDEMLTPLGRLDKYVASENIFNRQMVARSLLDTLKAVSEDERDCIGVLERVGRLADDSEPSVRAELMEQVPHIAIFCQENRPSIPFAFSKYLLPIVVRYLADQNNQVRKTSQAALLVLLEQELVERGDIETLVCPVLVDLTAPDSNDDVKTEAMAIICKMAPMVGKDITERLFLPRFCEMCCDCRMFHVRKVCAANFGDICSVVGGEATEELLLPRFFQLCSDNVWGVRKACAECFMTVSSSTSQEVRRTKLSSLFINLISDPSRWVRQAAFQSLGQFISTFASPNSVGQYFREGEEGECNCVNSQNSIEEKPLNLDTTDPSLSANTDDSQRRGDDSPVCTNGNNVEGCLQQDCISNNAQGDHSEGEDGGFCRTEEEIGGMDVAEQGGGEQAAEALADALDVPECLCRKAASSLASNPDSSEEGDSSSTAGAQEEEEAPSVATESTKNEPQPHEKCTSSNEKDDSPADILAPSSFSLPEPAEEESPFVSPLDNIPEQELYNSFHFWRLPIAEMDLELLQQGESVQEEPPSYVSSSQGKTKASAPVLDRKQLEELIENLEPHIDDPDVKAQVDVLTAALRATTMDSHLEDAFLEPRDSQGGHHYDNPFGVHQMPLIGHHSDMERRNSTLQMNHGDDSELSDSSFSPEDEKKSKHQDVIPQALLDQYLSMTDPSRAQTVDMEIAKHCAYSLPGVAMTLGRQNWHCLRDTYETLASDMQWKVRRTLAFSIHELALILGDQLTAADLVPIFNGFLKDLDEVRVGVLKHLYHFLKVSEIIRKVASCQVLLADFLSELVEKFCHSPKWSGRQAFTFICQLAIEDDCVSLEQFSEHLLAPLLQLASDPVANVRVLLAKTIRQSLLEREYFLHSANSHQEALEQTLVALQMDLDKDVKYFASVHPGSTRLSEDAMSTTSSTY
uniref:Protein phosphatase 4, regulatory subunit 1 n=1 Tax=Salmo trutta TaxID=8032 RepID=A0A673Y3W6_SALTR